MAREYLYKAKCKDNGEWVYGLPKYDDSGAIYYFEVVKEWARIYGIIPETICEYTGLKDKNGTKIFEGDIIQGTITSQWNKRLIHCEVVFDNGCFISVETDGHPWSHKLKFAKDIEVIGNKFDNDLEVQDE